MTRERDPERQCAGKRPYPKQSNAANVAFRMMRQRNEHYQAYHCPHCDQWHVGHGEVLVREGGHLGE